MSETGEKVMEKTSFSEAEQILSTKNKLIILSAKYGIVVAFILLFISMSFLSNFFLTRHNIFNVMTQTAPILIVGLGMTFILGCGEIDLSVGSAIALSSAVIGTMLAAGYSFWVVCLALIVLGLLIGSINAFFTIKGVPSFIVTLGMLTLLRGAAFVYTDGYSVRIQNEIVRFIGRGRIFGIIPFPALVSIILAVIAFVFISFTRTGIYVLAVGGNEDGARKQGISTHKTKAFVFILTSILAMLAGLIVTGRLGTGTPNAGQMFELDVITAVVLGGTSLFGGYATILGTAVGALFVGFVRNGLNLMGVSPFWVEVFIGAILIFAVYFNTKVSVRLKEMIRLAEMKGGA